MMKYDFESNIVLISVRPNNWLGSILASMENHCDHRYSIRSVHALYNIPNI